MRSTPRKFKYGCHYGSFNNRKIVHVPYQTMRVMLPDMQMSNLLVCSSKVILYHNVDLLPDCSLRSFEVCGGSMMPTLFDNDIIISNCCIVSTWQSTNHSTDILL
ncbi:MAG: S24/S26 family peptidase [Saprospiraceae bacterium]|nr:S24/S26 family peptidase [Saprospiraceae bacterium]